MAEQSRRRISGSLVCMILAVICLGLAAFGVKLSDVNLFYLGLAFWAASRIF